MKKIFLLVLLITFMGLDYGAAVAQKGYDVKTCADRFLCYSSAFQTLKVFATYAVSTTVPNGGINTITINHNLGNYAPFLIVYNGSSRIGVAQSNFFHNGVFTIAHRMYANKLEIDVEDIYGNYGWPESQSGDTVYFTVYIFLDDFSTIAEKNINAGTTSGASSVDYGLRISKEGYDVKTCTDDQCVLSSSFFNQIVHKKGITTAATVSHNLGYIPNFLSYQRAPGSDFIFFEGFWGSTTTTEFNTELVGAGYTAYYIIFKDKCN